MSMINNALSGAIAAQAALSTNSQNIANAMTPGYTRQGVLLNSVMSGAQGQAAAGNGVTVSALLRFADGYKSQQLWQAASNLGHFSAAQPYLNQLEKVMSDDTSNINQGLDAFFAALNAASVEPDSLPLRAQVLTSAEGLARRFNSMQQLLGTQSNAINEQQQAAAKQINGYSADIALLNKQIAAGRAAGINVSGLLDARDQRIDKLSGLVGLQVVDQPDGSTSVSLKNGQPLVIGTEAAVANIDLGTGKMSLQFANSSFEVRDADLGGQLGGLREFQRNILAPMQTQLKDLADGLVTAVNGQLAAGQDMAGNPGGALFGTVGTDGRLSINPALKPDQLAFAKAGSAAGNSENLAKLIGLRDSVIVGGVNLGDVFTQMVGKLGVQSQQNIAGQKTAKTVRDQSEENWKSTSGVNSDEEAIDLMQYKQMYEANMKVVAVANQLFDSLLAMA
ncbi:flagellar hook-associated protein FlgK [Roseateles sp. DAIF2]|uniref:flagellar hook-associated protein FlgK n=1 Tax=Roseateles sp. DAIF2 TaxID=2714952 RepID=UPI0018A2E0BC|nr:flagellar hook-associated protein FlgK [Roseateles sp. DAIF2]QPF74147.1 flagellar hook-associated protein FlgK [Roseateles sp. DAIF2]